MAKDQVKGSDCLQGELHHYKRRTIVRESLEGASFVAQACVACEEIIDYMPVSQRAKRVIIQRLHQEAEVSWKGMPVIEACLKATQWIAKQQRSDRESAAIDDDVQDFYGEAEHQTFRANEQVSKSHRCL